MKIRDCILAALSALVLAACAGGTCAAQDGHKELGGKLMAYIVEDGDTVYLSPLAAARIYEKKKRNKGREWRKYYRLVYNFAKAYPYALIAKDIVSSVDSTIKTDGLARGRKGRYVDAVIAELFRKYEKPLRKLTVTQGELLMRLIDRECGYTPYAIIVEFKSRFTAGFWQGVAWLFGEDLKRPYDPSGEDEAVEELVRQWEEGTFEQTYYEIFWEYPPEPPLPGR